MLFRSVTALRPDGMQPVAELLEQLAALGEPVLLVGDAVEEIPAAAFLHAASPATKLQNGAGICLAAAQAAWQTPEELFPEYLQLVKAEKTCRKSKGQSDFMYTEINFQKCVDLNCAKL